MRELGLIKCGGCCNKGENVIKEKDVIKSAVIINKDIKGKNEMSNSKESFGKNIKL